MQQKYIIFTSLLIDLLAFTLILPLLPKILDYYEINNNDSIYSYMQIKVNEFRDYLIGNNQYKGINSVLFGGIIGSLFSFLQFLSASFMGALSDYYGRKPILMINLIGTLISYIMWSYSSTFTLFLMSRIIGGISKSNVSLCISIMTDITDLASRSSAMAFVGIAFSLGFLFGPSIGAVFSTVLSKSVTLNDNIFKYPAYLAITLNIINIIFIAKFFKESLPKENRAKSLSANFSRSLQFINPISLFKYKPVEKIKDLNSLQKISISYFLYLFIYSGLEFTLTFLVHNRFNYNSMQQGKMFLFIGIVMSLVQGGYVRRIKQNRHISATIKGICVQVPSFLLIALAQNQILFYLGLLFYSYGSAIVVSCLTTVVSNFGNVDEKGVVMGIFRSLGALSRATGPIIASIAYWSFGAEFAYIFGGVSLIIPLCVLISSNKQKLKSI